jgi:late competence protein required for DNA uptake (superfamily II DNA/RNA helicase)
MFCWLPIVKKFMENKNIAYIIINDHMAPLLIFFDVIQMLEQVLEVEDEELDFDTM